MSHNDIYKVFQTLMPGVHKQVDVWFQNGKNSIRLRLTNGREYIFTFRGLVDWRFETIDSFIKSMRGGPKG